MSAAVVAGTRRTTDADIVLAYRHTFKALLRAVQYSQPARFTARDCVRSAFRRRQREDFEAVKVSRTIEMLDNAARTRGLEHKIVKNLMHAWWERDRMFKNPHMRPEQRAMAQAGYKDFDRTIEALNQSMGLCIK